MDKSNVATANSTDIRTVLRGNSTVIGAEARPVLSSWKEIATYFGKGIRTVQRWERNLGLPIRRPNGHNNGIVLAYPDELKDWTNFRPVPDSDALHQNNHHINYSVEKYTSNQRKLCSRPTP
jgi:hypothetical protein